MVTNSQVFSVENCCDFVLNSVRNSYLNYSVQETPYSVYLTIRKSFANNKISPGTGQTLPLNNNQKSVVENRNILKKEIENLKIRLKASEDSNLILKQNYEDTLSDCEESYKKIKRLEDKAEQEKMIKDDMIEDALKLKEKNKIIKELKDINTKLENHLKDIEKNHNVLNKLVKSKEKETHDLKKENLKVIENLEEVKANFANLTAAVNREKRQEEKKTKKKEEKISWTK